MISYPVPEEVRADIENRFVYHQPLGDQAERYVTLREAAKNLAFLILSLTPKSREQSLALTYLEETIYSANAAIARHETASWRKEAD
jgi:hypothetical protein